MKCTNCNKKMIDDYSIKIKNTSILAHIVLKKGHEENSMKACVCPSCGKVEFYIEK